MQFLVLNENESDTSKLMHDWFLLFHLRPIGSTLSFPMGAFLLYRVSFTQNLCLFIQIHFTYICYSISVMHTC